ncbi:MobF family relaxase [Corynebacterium mucifaciens]|uniref:Conjugative relaxase-like TrwC/TraI family protein n=1 Tax=Corynebacterium mucifaciens TaxID=57171 RepID=A0ABV2NYG2_9CORY|nr:MobF family relaxase [Corynebacterium mucifaciens]
MLRWRAGGGGLGWEVVAAVLTIAKLHGESVAYYESTVDAERVVSAGPDGYYSEDGSAPARAWVVARSGDKAARVVAALGVEVGARVEGAGVRGWFNKAVAPSGVKLGRAPGVRGVPGFDLTFCAPKSVSIIWGLSQDAAVRRAVDVAHARAVESALGYLAEHAGYTRRADGVDRSVMVVDRLEGLSGVRYEHRTSRAGDPHVHSHVLLANKQLCADGKWRTVDGVGLFHEARAAGTIYQAVLREELSTRLGVRWAEVSNGCAEIKGLDNRALIKKFSARMSEIDQWRASGPGTCGDISVARSW